MQIEISSATAVVRMLRATTHDMFKKGNRIRKHHIKAVAYCLLAEDCPHGGSLGSYLSSERKSKTLIILDGCPG